MLADTAFLFDYEPSSAHLSSFPPHILLVSPAPSFSSSFAILFETMSRTLRNEDFWHVFLCPQSLFPVQEGNCTGSDWYVLDRPTWPPMCFFAVLAFTNNLSDFLAFPGNWCWLKSPFSYLQLLKQVACLFFFVFPDLYEGNHQWLWHHISGAKVNSTRLINLEKIEKQIPNQSAQ